MRTKTKPKTELRYRAKARAPFKARHAQAIGTFIEDLQGNSVDDILGEIEQCPNHVLHNYIEWNNKKASHAYRKWQIRNIINHLEIVKVEVQELDPDDPNRTKEVERVLTKTARQGFISVSAGDNEEQEYVGYKAAITNKSHKQEMIDNAVKSLRAWVFRYQDIPELWKVRDAIVKALT